MALSYVSLIVCYCMAVYCSITFNTTASIRSSVPLQISHASILLIAFLHPLCQKFCWQKTAWLLNFYALTQYSNQQGSTQSHVTWGLQLFHYVYKGNRVVTCACSYVKRCYCTKMHLLRCIIIHDSRHLSKSFKLADMFSLVQYYHRITSSKSANISNLTLDGFDLGGCWIIKSTL